MKTKSAPATAALERENVGLRAALAEALAGFSAASFAANARLIEAAVRKTDGGLAGAARQFFDGLGRKLEKLQALAQPENARKALHDPTIQQTTP